MDDELVSEPALEVGGRSATGKKPKQKKKFTKTLIYFAVVFLLTGYSIFSALNGNIESIGECFKIINWYFFILACGVVFLSFMARSLIYFCFARLYTRKYTYSQALALDQVGIFYSAVTPLNTGGQFVQCYTMKRQGIQMSSAVSIFVMYSVMYQIVLILYGIVSFIVVTINYGSSFLNMSMDILGLRIPMWGLVIFGFVCNIGYILIILLLTYWKGFQNFIAGPCVNLLHKMHLLKDPEKSRNSIHMSMENYRLEFRRLFTNIPFTILIGVLLVVFLTISFSIPFFTGVALGNTSSIGTGITGFFNSVFFTNLHQLISGVIPIPGGAGVSELIFNAFFYAEEGSSTNYYDSAAMCSSAMLLWRSITFTIPLFIAGIFSTIYKGAPKKEATQEQRYGYRIALHEIESETLSIRREELIEMEHHTKEISREELYDKLSSDNQKSKKSHGHHLYTDDDSPYTINREDDD